MAGQGVDLVADLGQFAPDTDSVYLSRFFVPALREAGDFRAAAVMNSQGRALIYKAGPQFSTDWARPAANAAGNELDFRPGPVAEKDLVAWLVAHRLPSRK